MAPCACRATVRQEYRVRQRPAAATPRSCIAVIVPFRDQLEQDRSAQLKAFEQHMTAFLKGGRFVIIVVRQSQDGRKFNRGQLLNAGAQTVARPGA